MTQNLNLTEAKQRLEWLQRAQKTGEVVGRDNTVAREEVIGKALVTLGRSYGVEFVAPIYVNSNGEVPLNVVQPPVASPRSATLKAGYGEKLASLLNHFSPRCGTAPGARLLAESSWCWMNHFDAERLVIRAAELQSNQKKRVLAQVGYSIAPDSDQDGLWVWRTKGDGCDISFGSEMEAIDGAWVDALSKDSTERDSLTLAEQVQAVKKEAGLPCYVEGQVIISLRGELDTDEDGQERVTPPGAMGVLDHESNPGQWSVHFDNGAAVFIDESELADASSYEILPEDARHYPARAELMSEVLGLEVVLDSTRPGQWLWVTPSGSSGVTFDSQVDAIGFAWARAAAQSCEMRGLSLGEWAAFDAHQKLAFVRETLVPNRDRSSER